MDLTRQKNNNYYFTGILSALRIFLFKKKTRFLLFFHLLVFRCGKISKKLRYFHLGFVLSKKGRKRQNTETGNEENGAFG